jgi:predicted nicotinamide N-methyase
MIREFAFSPTNANFVWPNNGAIASYITENQAVFEGRNILELGSGTGDLVVVETE